MERFLPIRSLVGFGTPFEALALPVALPERSYHDARRRPISERTSYPGTRLAFHRYPHLIQRFCSTDWFRPPDSITCPSPWAWVDRSASRLPQAT